jgi:TP901 family phage tail tape measure protein
MAGEAEIERMVVRLLGDASQYEQSLKRAGKATKTFAQRATAQLRKVSQSMKSLGRSLSLRVTAPLTILGAVSVKAFSNFDKAMTESTSIMDVTEKQMAKMQETALGLSAGGKVLQGPKDLAEAYFFLASANKDAEQSMALLPKVSAFATAGAFDMALATDILTDAQSSLGLSSKDVAQDTANLVRISDMLVKANTLANASVQQFGESLIADAATASKTVNAELETTIAILALYADKGKKAAESGNLFGRAIRLLTKSARDNAKEFAKRNIKVIDDVTKEYRNFIDILEDMNQAFAGLTKPEIGKALSDLGFAALAQKAILPLLGATDQLKFYEAELLKAGGITQEVADKQMKAFGNQMKVLKNQLTVVAIKIGQILAPVILEINKLIKKAIDWWEKLSKETKKFIVFAGAIAAVVGPALIILGSTLGFVVSVFGLLGFAVTGVAAALASLPFLAVVGGIIAVITALLGLEIAAFRFTGLWEKALEGYKKLWDEVLDHLKPAMDGIRDALASDRIRLALEIGWAQIKLSFAQVVKYIQELWAGLAFQLKIEWASALASTKKETLKWKTWFEIQKVKFDPLLDKKTEQGLINSIKRVSKAQEDAIDRETAKRIKEAKKVGLGSLTEISLKIKGLREARDRLTGLAAGQMALDAARAADKMIGQGVLPGIPGADKDGRPKGLGGALPRVAGAQIQAAQVGTAEAQSRIMAFRAGAGITDAKRTADNTEEIKDILTDIRDGEGMAGNLQPAGLRRS